jgi:hypothetical protein
LSLGYAVAAVTAVCKVDPEDIHDLSQSPAAFLACSEVYQNETSALGHHIQSALISSTTNN